MRFVAGIDGGGTKTRVCCRDLKGKQISAREFGAFNLNSIGNERFRILLKEISSYLNSTGECAAVCIGSAGASNGAMLTAVKETMQEAGIGCWKLVGDHVIALSGALAGEEGIIIIAGTGSICFGRGADGKEARAGGWGHLIGDEGSGYALGRDALAAVAKERDGYGEKTVLTELFASELGLDTPKKIISYAYSGDKSVVAALSPLVEKAASAGDSVARSIIEDNAEKMSALVGAVAEQLRLKETEAAMLGGMLENDTLLRRAFVDTMQRKFPDISCISPKKNACEGAVMIAEKMLQGEKHVQSYHGTDQ